MEQSSETITHHARSQKEWPTGLKNSSAVADAIGITADRVDELAASGHMPHYVIDGGGRLYKPAECKRWAAQNLIDRCEGASLNPTYRPCVMPPTVEQEAIPASIREIPGVRPLPFDVTPGVYFLISGIGEVVYIGQSVNPISRVNTHIKNIRFSIAYFLPVPSDSLNSVEGALIRLFRPPQNGRVQGNGKTMTAPMEPIWGDNKTLEAIGMVSTE